MTWATRSHQDLFRLRSLDIQLRVQQLEDLITREAVWIDKAAKQWALPTSTCRILCDSWVLTALQGDRWAQMRNFWMVALVVLLVRWMGLCAGSLGDARRC